jgi:hypothetical protein
MSQIRFVAFALISTVVFANCVDSTTEDDSDDASQIDTGDAEPDDGKSDDWSKSLPAQGVARYAYETFVNGASRKGARQTIAKAPDLGTFVVEVFIKNDRVRVKPAGIPLPTAYMSGDKRDFDPNFSPNKTRLFAVIDFTRGAAWAGANVSRMMECNEFPPHFCKTIISKNPHNVNASFSNGNNRIWTDWVNHDVMRVRIKGTVSLPLDAESLGCSADSELLINVTNQTVVREGDAFPSIGVYWYGKDKQQSAPSKVLLQSSQADVNDLCGEPSYSTPRKALTDNRPS